MLRLQRQKIIGGCLSAELYSVYGMHHSRRTLPVSSMWSSTSVSASRPLHTNSIADLYRSDVSSLVTTVRGFCGPTDVLRNKKRKKVVKKKQSNLSKSRLEYFNSAKKETANNTNQAKANTNTSSSMPPVEPKKEAPGEEETPEEEEPTVAAVQETTAEPVIEEEAATDVDVTGDQEAREDSRSNPQVLYDDADELEAMAPSTTATAVEDEVDVGEVEDGQEQAAGEPAVASAPEIGSLLDFESAINLRLATLTQQGGRAFRTIAVRFPLERGSMNFEITFEDLGSGAQLVCTLDKVKTYYMEWASQFRASFIVLFLPTLQHANATLLMNAIFAARPGRPPPPAGSYHPRLNEDADHLFFSYQKLREVISKKKRDTNVDARILMVTVLNAYADEWKNYINTPGACAPQMFLQAAYHFRSTGGVAFNKELLHAQLSAAADCMSLFPSDQTKNQTGKARRKVSGATLSHLSSTKPLEQWKMVFVSAPVKTAAGTSAIPPMQDLLTGQFVDPMTLSICNVVYIIGTGSAAESFSMFPLASKGKTAYSILLQDIESQLGIQRAQRVSLTNMLAQALDNFSRLTWMGLMQEERGELRVPHPPNAFYKLQRRTVQREIMPSFLENVFSPASRLAGRDTGADGADPSLAAATPAKSSRRLEEYIASIFNTTERLDREKALKDDLTQCKTLFITIDTAGITAARRSDNPFSDNNGLVSAETQYWNSLALFNTPPIHVKSAKENEVGGFSDFLEADGLIPDDFPIGPSSASNTKTRATNGVIVAWDAKRVLLFLRHSKKLRQFLLNGGRVWCAQYAQYILKGFNHHHLSSMERTLLQYHAGPIKTPLHPLAKLKLIYETQLNLAMQTRQLLSTAARMDGLLASAEMEKNGLQLVPQDEVTTFSNNLKLDHDRLEKVLQEKVFDFTRHMDDDVRQRINFRSPQDISTIIYGGALCRHLGSRFVPVRPARFPMTSLFPHAICKVTGCAVPAEYLDPKTLLGESQVGENYAHTFGAAEVNNALDRIHKISVKLQLEHLRHSTAVVVVIAKSRIGGFIEQFSLYCPGQAGSSEPEINVHVAVEDILPVTEKPDLVTISQLKKMIKAYKPLQHLQPLKKYGKKSYEVRNVLVLTSCNHDRLEPLVDSGIMTAIEETVLGPRAGGEEIPFERICFADLQKAFPPVAQDNDSFESDFSELTGVTSLTFSAKENWEANTGGPNAAGGYEEIFGGLVSHCASAIGTPRDAFRNSHPVPSALPRGVHGQEQASTDGMLWLVTPPNLHPLLRKFLAGKAASSGADAMERVTVLLSPYKEVDLTFFTALQQLRFTEKKMQLFEEGCLFRAVLPENHDRVHGELCHCVTATGRLSSQSPNLQNIPKEQDLRRLLVSRFGKKGRMIEADYSQLEVVVLAALSRDAKMLEELREKVDFHCMRVSLMTKEPYAEVVKKAKVEKDPHYVQLRQQAKVFSFQRQYGAGVATISTTTGLTEEEVDRLIAAEEKHYRDLNKYYRLVTDCVEGGADRLLRMRSLDLWDAPSRRIVMLTEPLHYFVVPTGSKFDFSKDRKSVPKLKNYPVQGLAGEIVQIMCGRIVRHFFEKKNYSNKAFLVNTVHDCVWVDCHEDVAKEVEADLQTLMTSTQTVMGTLFPELKLDVEFGVEVKSGQSLGEL